MCRPQEASVGRRWRGSRRGPRSPGLRHLPRDVVERWTDVMAKLARDPAWLAGVEKLGGIAAVRSPAETDKFVRDQYQLYERLAERPFRSLPNAKEFS